MTILDSINELLPRLYDLHHQATAEHSHHYVGSTLRTVIDVLERIKASDGKAATLFGQLPSGKNAVQITRTGKRYPGKRFSAWRAEAMRQIASVRTNFDGPVRLTVEYTPGDKRRRDVPGLLDALCHLLEKAKIVNDDAQITNVHWLTLPINTEPKCVLHIEELIKP